MSQNEPIEAENTQENTQRNPAEHLKEYRWPKGYCPNPGGRPKSRQVSERLRAALEEGDADVIGDVLLTAARAGKIEAIKEIIDRTEGKAKQTIESDTTVTVYQPSSLANLSTEELESLRNIARKLTQR